MSTASTLIVYTAIIADIADQLRPVIAPKDSCGRKVRYICFSDRISSYRAKNLGWEVYQPRFIHLNNSRRTARWHKVNSHLLFPEDPISLWLDGSHQLKDNPWALVEQYLNGVDLATFKHGERSCVYDELAACIRLKKDDPQVMSQQVDRYRAKGYPAGAGLFETSVMLRRNSQAVSQFNDLWWQEITQGSFRDQLSVNWVASLTGIKTSLIAGSRASSPHFHFFPHR